MDNEESEEGLQARGTLLFCPRRDNITEAWPPGTRFCYIIMAQAGYSQKRTPTVITRCELLSVILAWGGRAVKSLGV